MPTDSVQQFLEEVQRSGLLPADALARATQDLQPFAPALAREAADRLVRDQLLTRYQADELLAGRGEECVIAGR
ncbi:MAG TPA: hypothetical protein VEL76_22125 [Gemmataceae bacterium]|nr:hypothetical protein [Gemmataceae bacterium]